MSIELGKYIRKVVLSFQKHYRQIIMFSLLEFKKALVKDFLGRFHPEINQTFKFKSL